MPKVRQLQLNKKYGTQIPPNGKEHEFYERMNEQPFFQNIVIFFRAILREQLDHFCKEYA